ncbi:MAG: GSCFA domain-containing protein [Bdellovibrionia bacterium]
MKDFIKKKVSPTFLSLMACLNPRRYFPGPHKGMARYQLKPSQVYPQGNNLDKLLEEQLRGASVSFKFDKKTPLSSMGSCFAEEFASYMVKEKFNYLQIEKDALMASANWGRVYTIKNFSQIVDYSLDENFPVIYEKCEKGYFDPLRESFRPFFTSHGELVQDVKSHRKISKQVFQDSKIFVFTLGQNEAWFDEKEGVLWTKHPPSDVMANHPGRFKVKKYSLEENTELLRSL